MKLNIRMYRWALIADCINIMNHKKISTEMYETIRGVAFAPFARSKIFLIEKLDIIKAESEFSTCNAYFLSSILMVGFLFTCFLKEFAYLINEVHLTRFKLTTKHRS